MIDFIPCPVCHGLAARMPDDIEKEIAVCSACGTIVSLNAWQRRTHDYIDAIIGQGMNIARYIDGDSTVLKMTIFANASRIVTLRKTIDRAQEQINEAARDLSDDLREFKRRNQTGGAENMNARSKYTDPKG